MQPVMDKLYSSLALTELHWPDDLAHLDFPDFG